MDVRLAAAALAAISVLLLNACGGGGGGSSGTPTPPPPAATFTATSGVAQKGPLISGSTVTAQELDASLSPTGRQFSYQITSDLGAFAPTSTFTSQYLGVSATGYYFDEVLGTVSSGPVTLNSYNDLAANGVLNVNILTTLAYQRIRNLVTSSQLSFAAARTQAEREVLTALGIPVGSYGMFGALDLRGNTDGDHVLAAVSALFVNSNDAGQLSVLINNFQSDLGSNGRLTNATTLAALASAAHSLDANSVAANLNQRYAALGVTFSPANITDWIDVDGDGIVGKFEFRVADATPSTIFTLPNAVVNAMAGMSVSATGGEFAVNGTPVATTMTVHSGDTLTLSPNAGSFPNGVLAIYLTSGSTKLARVNFVSGLLTLDVTPAAPSLAKGLTQQFTATGTFSDGSTLDLSDSVNWTSTSPAVATLSATGLAQTLAVGATTIAATSGAISSDTLFTVTAAVPVSLGISPQSLRSGVGLTLQPAARATYTDGNLADVTNLVSWTSSTPSVASIDAGSGLITGVSLGSSQVDATLGSLTTSAQLAIVTNEWTSVGDLFDARTLHTATLLPSGKVLVVGGRLPGVPVRAGAELYDPVKRTWSNAGNSAFNRSGHTATLLPNGRVLVAGGAGNEPPTNEVVIYDPLTNAWTQGPAMAVSRLQPTATLLPDGRVLVAGGRNLSGTVASAELYDPSTNSWSPASSMATPRTIHTATLLADGTVLVTGGMTNPTSTQTAERYDPATNTWTATASLSAPRHGHTATLLPNATVLVAGGGLASAELYDPIAGTWSPAGSMTHPRYLHTATLLSNGKVLFVAGIDATVVFGDVDAYDSSDGTWSVAPSIANSRFEHTATLLPHDVVLVTGGRSRGSPDLISCEAYW